VSFPPENPEPIAPEPEDLLPPPPPPPREPFWGYNDLLVFFGIVFGAFAIAAAILLPFRAQDKVIVTLSFQLVFYVLLFGGLAAFLRLSHDRPFWRSLGWVPMRLPFSVIIVAGMTTAILVALGAGLIHVPDTPTPMTDLMKGRAALITMGIFGVTAAPIAEELAFRGFFQPLFVRSLGVVPGILLTAILFGLLHFQEYGNSWTHVLLICFAGAMFGAMRQLTGSTKAAALMHASYNALFFIAVFSTGKGINR